MPQFLAPYNVLHVRRPIKLLYVYLVNELT